MVNKLAKNVNSSWIKKVVYYKGNLYIETVRDKVYMYEDVPFDLAVKLTEAESAGKFFHEHIKDQYKMEHI